MAGLNYVTFNQDHSLLAVGTFQVCLSVDMILTSL